MSGCQSLVNLRSMTDFERLFKKCSPAGTLFEMCAFYYAGMKLYRHYHSEVWDQYNLFFFKQRINTFIQPGHIQFIKSASKGICNVKKYFLFEINAVL